jgi:peptidoglycan/LPS O-acetylase OafA/YrhL
VYRADIDGLRAVAIIPVVLYHCELSGFGGGFVGVDVFFVISGFLITNLLSDKLQNNTFSFSEFYERRIRRLAPALVFVLLSSFVVAFIYFTQLDFVLFSKSLVATSAFLSNVHFMRQTSSYFAVDSAFKPLLHTWSLAVEEQFYFAYPAFLFLLIRRFGGHVVQILISFLVLSFIGSCVGVVFAPEATFYLLPTRAWELLLGAIISLYFTSKDLDPVAREWMAGLGIVGIAVAVWSLNSQSPFPGINALPPCLGAALIIWANTQTTIVSRVLSSPFVVFFGLISYSLYLWHWPIIMFYKYIVNDQMNLVEKLLVVALAVFVATLSWRFVELPIRRRRDGLNRWTVFVLAGSVSVCLAMLGLWGVVDNGVPERLASQITRYGASASDVNPERSNCNEMTPDQILRGDFCKVGLASRKPDFLVWGDSHADPWMPVFDAIARERGKAGWFAVYNGCPSLLGIRLPGVRTPKCREFNEAVAKAIERENIHVVILISRWSLYIYGNEHAQEAQRWLPDPIISAANGPDVSATDLDGKKRIFESGVSQTLEWLLTRGIRTWIVDEVPLQSVDVPNYLARMASTGKMPLGRLRSEIEAREAFVRGIFERYSNKIAGQIDPVTVLCPANEMRCRIEERNSSLYADNNHLSVFGAKTLSALLDPLFQSITLQGY